MVNTKPRLIPRSIDEIQEVGHWCLGLDGNAERERCVDRDKNRG